MISIRKERPPDIAAREALLDEAFGNHRWRKSSQRLRDGRSPAEGLAFVATDGKRVIGTARLWDIVCGTGHSALLLGPVAVASDCRNRGIGAALSITRLTRPAGAVIARSSSSAMRPITAVSASRRRRPAALRMPGPFERHRLLALELVPGALKGARGLLRAPSRPAVAAGSRCLRRIISGIMSWTPGRFRPASIPFALRHGYDQLSLETLTMPKWPVHARIDGPIVMIGFGSIGKGTLPLIERHFSYDKKRFVVIDPEDKDRKLLDQRGIRFIHQAVTKDNYRHLLTPLLTAGGGQGFCVNVSVDTSSLDIMELCREIGALYIDTVVEPWKGFYFDPKLGPEARSNYALRETILAARRKRPGGPTAVSCCGANPGMVSWFVKQALLNIAGDVGLKFKEPKTREEWARLAKKAGIKGIHIAERDTQRAKQPKPMNVFVNTWSVEGFISEGLQPAELGWGTHEKWMPANARRHKTGCGAAIYLLAARRQYARALMDADRAGATTASWSRTMNRSRSPTTSRSGRAAKPSTGRPATTPITPAMTRCCRCTKCSAAPARRRKTSTFSTSMRSPTGSTSSACCSTATRRMPIGMARSSRSTRPAKSRHTRTPRACR